MANFTVRYVNGHEEVLVAERFRESGPWIVFVTGRRDHVLVSAESVLRIDRTDPNPGTPTRQPVLFRWVFGVLVAGVGLLTVAIGSIDMFSAETVSGRLLGVVLAAAGATCLAGVYGVSIGGYDGRHWALNGAMVATAIPLGLLGVQAAGGGDNRVLTVALLVCAVASLALALRLWSTGARPRMPGALRGFVAAGIVVGLFQFWYDKEYLPASREAGLTEVVELTAGPVPEGGAFPAFVTATITLKNVSGTKVRVIGSHFNLWNFDPGRGEPQFVASGPLSFGDGNWLSPGQDFAEKVVFRVPGTVDPGMRLDVTVHVTKGDRFPHGRRVRCPGTSCPVAWRIGESSLVNRLTREPRWVVQLSESTEVRVAGAAQTQLRPTALTTCIARVPDDCAAQDPKLNDLYGRVTITAGTETVLEAKPAAQAPRAASP